MQPGAGAGDHSPGAVHVRSLKLPTDPDTYRRLRTKLGPQSKVAAMLGVAVSTVARRETGVLNINREEGLALAFVHRLGGILP